MSYRAPKFPGIPGPYVARPPTVDDDEVVVAERAQAGGWDPVPDWTAEATQIVRIRRVRDETGKDLVNGQEAMARFKAAHGQVLQNLSDARWWAARVWRK